MPKSSSRDRCGATQTRKSSNSRSRSTLPRTRRYLGRPSDSSCPRQWTGAVSQRRSYCRRVCVLSPDPGASRPLHARPAGHRSSPHMVRRSQHVSQCGKTGAFYGHFGGGEEDFRKGPVCRGFSHVPPGKRPACASGHPSRRRFAPPQDERLSLWQQALLLILRSPRKRASRRMVACADPFPRWDV